MLHVNLIKITYTIYTKEMKVNQTRHLNYTKNSKRRNEGQKTGRHRKKQNGNNEWALSFNSYSSYFANGFNYHIEDTAWKNKFKT